MLSKIFTIIFTVLGVILVISAILGVMLTIVIAAFELHWFIGSMVGCFCALATGLFFINIVEDQKQ